VHEAPPTAPGKVAEQTLAGQLGQPRRRQRAQVRIGKMGESEQLSALPDPAGFQG